MNLKGTDGNEPTEDSNLLNSGEKKPQDSPTEPRNPPGLRRFLPPRGWLARVITNGVCTVGMNFRKRSEMTPQGEFPEPYG